MLWYQRSPGETVMKLIGYLHYQDDKMEELYKNKFIISGDLGGNTAKNSSLSVKITSFQQSAIYYCAASYAQWL